MGGATTTNDSVRINLLRMIYSGIIETPNNEMANLGTTGVKGIIGSYGGEYIKFDGNKVLLLAQKNSAGQLQLTV